MSRWINVLHVYYQHQGTATFSTWIKYFQYLDSLGSWMCHFFLTDVNIAHKEKLSKRKNTWIRSNSSFCDKSSFILSYSVFVLLLCSHSTYSTWSTAFIWWLFLMYCVKCKGVLDLFYIDVHFMAFLPLCFFDVMFFPPCAGVHCCSCFCLKHNWIKLTWTLFPIRDN